MSTYVKRGRPATDPIDRFWSRIDRSGDCWTFTGAHDKDGRAKFYWFGTATNAALVAWELIKGERPKKSLRNTCGFVGCCNPDHWRDTYSPPRVVLPYDERWWRRFRSRVREVLNVPDLGPCWEWQRSIDKNGYAHVSYRGKSRFTHIIAYIVACGEVPDGLELDHLCRVRHCCNPDHLEAVTHQENCRRSPIHVFFHPELRRNPGPPKQTHCKHGHELTPENRYPRGGRCIACSRNYASRHHRKGMQDPAWVEKQRARKRKAS